MKTLHIPDVHEDISSLERIISKYENDVDEIVFKGDFLDSFESNGATAQRTIYWLYDNVSNPKYKFLWGNHDINYAFHTNVGLWCSGHKDWRQNLVEDKLTYNNCWKYFKLIYWSNNFLCSHAGVHPKFFKYKNITKEILDEKQQQVLEDLNFNIVDPWLMAGRSRGGLQSTGGVTWLDWDEFVPIPNINQIVGHTRKDGSIRTNNTENSINYCIDSGLKKALLVDGDKIEIVEV